MRWFAFNGDADGLCALQQLRLADPQRHTATLVTGVKRDIELLARVPARSGDEVTVLDISLDSNRAALLSLLAAGVQVTWFDHHHAGELPSAPGFTSHIDTARDVCTSALVDRHLHGRHRTWAATAAFGDSMPKLGRQLSAGLAETAVATLERLGTALNYNAYGESLADLHFDPAALAAAMLPYEDPLAFAADSQAFARLWAGFEEDMAQARALSPLRRNASALALLLPDAAWARRVIGVLANELMQSHADTAIAILSPRQAGGLTVSLRVPACFTCGADDFCRRYPTGGGRRGAAGVNELPHAALGSFLAAFETAFAR